MSGRPRLLARLPTLRRAVLAEPMGFVWGIATNTATTTFSYWVAPHAQLDHLMIVHLLGVVLISTRFGFAVSTFTAITSVLAFDYFCIPPLWAFALPDRHGVVTFVGMLVTALTMCSLIQRLRHQRAVARASEARTLALCELSLDLSEVHKVDDLPKTAERHLERLFGVGAMVLLSGPTGELDLGSLAPSEREFAEASAELESKPMAWGAGGVGYHRIGTRPASLGLIRVSTDGAPPHGETEREMLVAACADRIGVSLERLALGDAARRAQVEAETERLRSALLSAVSHDLRTPLSSILAAGTTLIRQRPGDPETERELLETIVQETERLNTLVTNLLSVTRLESDIVSLNKTPEALEDLVYSVLSRLSTRLEGRDVRVKLAQDLPLVAMDPVLVDLLIVNLIENVLRYTPAGSPVAIQVSQRDAEVVLTIEDRGPGISETEREKVFEKFYRGSQGRLRHGGTGLGLTICRAVARAHGGRIAANPRPGGGTSIEFTLPCTDDPKSGIAWGAPGRELLQA